MPKILVIEDEEDQLFILKEILTSLISECKVITAQSGEEGIIKIKKELPDTILLDIKLPQMDGYEVCKILKSDELTKNIPIIMITGVYKDTESHIKALDLGVDAFLTKPVESGELEAQVNVMLRIKRVEDKLKKEKNLLEGLVQERTRKLKESEAKLRNFFESSTIGIWCFRGEHPVDINITEEKMIDELFKGVLVECNDTYAKMMGTTKDEIIGMRLSEVQPDTQENREYFKTFIRNGFRVEGEISHEITKKGEEKYFSNSFIGTVKNRKLFEAWGIKLI